MKQMRDSIRRLASFVDHVLNSTSLADEVRPVDLPFFLIRASCLWNAQVSTEFCVDYERMEACVIQRDWELQYATFANCFYLPVTLCCRFAALELQSLKYELEVCVQSHVFPPFSFSVLYRLNGRALLLLS
jgi:hypothetical protein